MLINSVYVSFININSSKHFWTVQKKCLLLFVLMYYYFCIFYHLGEEGLHIVDQQNPNVSFQPIQTTRHYATFRENCLQQPLEGTNQMLRCLYIYL